MQESWHEQARSDRPLTVLVVDDEPEARLLIRLTLELDGCRVVEASGGLEAVRKARRIAPDVIVSDLRMPGISGVETARLLSGLPGTRGIPRIAVTVEPPARLDPDELRALFFDVVRKPFAPDRLRGAVREAAGKG
jgi:two-component system, chemotaxis family, chemotaxis protein CheY